MVFNTVSGATGSDVYEFPGMSSSTDDFCFIQLTCAPFASNVTIAAGGLHKRNNDAD